MAMVKDDDGECMVVCVWGVDEGTQETPSSSVHDSAEGMIASGSGIGRKGGIMS